MTISKKELKRQITKVFNEELKAMMSKSNDSGDPNFARSIVKIQILPSKRKGKSKIGGPRDGKIKTLPSSYEKT